MVLMVTNGYQWGYTKTRDTCDDRDERDGITSDEYTIYRDDDIYVTAIFC